MGGGKHGHHGGAWKVAYADFVTAMMAFFLVMWLVSQDQKIKEAVEHSFRNPFGAMTRQSTGILNDNSDSASRSARGNFEPTSMVELTLLRKMSEDLLKSLQTNPELPDETPMRMDLLSDGIRLNMFDRNRKPLFKPGSNELSEYGEWIFTTLAWQINQFSNHFNIELEGHTENGFAAKPGGPDSWDLSTDRAHSARRILMKHDVQSKQIRRIAGYADTTPLPEIDIEDERNRRVTVILRAKENVLRR
jgi:chemotaxis protein MotB